MNLAFSYVTKGLEVSFRIMCKVPANSTISWDFGDDTEPSSEKNPSHTYETTGFYTVTLSIQEDGAEQPSTQCQLVMVSEEGIQTHLTDSIYNLIDNYIPQDIFNFTFEDKSVYIVKWQLYIAPLVNHEILPDKYQDELAYEGLENQLIMELAAWDFLNVQLMALLAKTGKGLSEMTNQPSDPEDPDEPGRIKKITTGPTEVEYFDKLSESISSMWKYYTQALQPGGIIDELRKNLCTLAQRLEIFIPFCDPVSRLRVPNVVNHRKPGPLSGPNPVAPLNKSKSFNK